MMRRPPSTPRTHTLFPSTTLFLSGQPQGMTLVLISVLATASAALVLYFWRRPASAVERTVSHAAARRPSTWAWAALAGVAAFAFSALATTPGQQAGVEQVPTNQPLIEAMGARNPALLLLVVALLAPAYDELLFRRVLFGRLWAEIGRASWRDRVVT